MINKTVSLIKSIGQNIKGTFFSDKVAEEIPSLSLPTALNIFMTFLFTHICATPGLYFGGVPTWL